MELHFTHDNAYNTVCLQWNAVILFYDLCIIFRASKLMHRGLENTMLIIDASIYTFINVIFVKMWGKIR